jgi:hypothetical protein
MVPSPAPDAPTCRQITSQLERNNAEMSAIIARLDCFVENFSADNPIESCGIMQDCGSGFVGYTKYLVDAQVDQLARIHRILDNLKKHVDF